MDIFHLVLSEYANNFTNTCSFCEIDSFATSFKSREREEAHEGKEEITIRRDVHINHTQTKLEPFEEGLTRHLLNEFLRRHVQVYSSLISLETINLFYVDSIFSLRSIKIYDS